MNNSTFSIDDIDWGDILVRLTAIAVGLAKGRSWFRGENTGTFVGGKNAADYAMETIRRFFEAPEKYNPEESSLLTYLARNIARGLISNDLTSAENRLCDPLPNQAVAGDDKDDEYFFVEQMMPVVEPLFADEVDYKRIKAYIESKIHDDRDVENVFLGIYSYNMKRREIMEEFKMSPAAYNNAKRRLDTVLRQTTDHFTDKWTVV